jgi:hypothetical protein
MPISPELQEFAKMLIQHVRDAAIKDCDSVLTPQSRSSVAERWRRAGQRGSPGAVLKEAIPDIVDTTLFWLLDAIDEGWLRLTYTAESGKVLELNDCDPGPLGGWMHAGREGWITDYSKERWIDDHPESDDPYQPYPVKR